MDSSDEEWISAVSKSAKILRTKKQTEPRRKSFSEIEKKNSTQEPKLKLNFDVNFSSSDDEIEFNVPSSFRKPEISSPEIMEENQLPKPKQSSEKKTSSGDEVDELEAFFTKMKTPSRALRPVSPEENELEDFIVSDSEDVGGEEIHHGATVNFNETTILNPDPVYTDDEFEEDNKENNSIIEIPSDPFSDSSDEFLRNITESAKKKIKKKERKLPRFTAGVTPDSIRKIMKTNVRNERINSPKTPKSKTERLLDRQLNRDFSPRKGTPSKYRDKTPVKTPTIKKSESTPCGYDQCILYDVEKWSTARLKDNLSELIEEIYETINRTIFAFQLPGMVKR